MREKLVKRRAFLIVIAIVLVAFDGGMGSLKYFSDQAIAKQQSDTATEIARTQQAVQAIKNTKIQEAKAAAQEKADADSDLAAQQAGEVITPKDCAISGHTPHGDPSAIDVVINKKHCFNPIDFAPSDLVTIDGATISAKAQTDFTAMFNAASAAGSPLSVTSSYRSYANQVDTYNGWVATNGSTQAADTVSARPGYSEHQTGLAIDFAAGNCSLECFLNTPQYTWLQANAASYGFVQRYPIGETSVTGYDSEAWHYRYVGKTVALDMKTKNIKTLEAYWHITGGDY